MNREGSETIPIEQLVLSLIDAAKKEDWEKVDKQLIPQLAQVDGNQMAQNLFGHVNDEDPNVRDVIATGLAAFEISDNGIRKEAIDKMVVMATEDEERFPAGRAATFLLKYRQDRNFKSQVENALDVFKIRARQSGWTQDFRESIPQLDQILSD